MITSTMHCLVIAAHPDDEVIGAGGFMAWHPGTSVAIVSDGTGSEAVDDLDALRRRKQQATHDAAGILTAIVVREGEFPDQRLELTRGLQLWIEETIEEHRPDVVITHTPTELNRDHRIVSEAVLVACRPYSRSGGSVKALLGMTVDPFAIAAPARGYGILSLALSEALLTRKLTACQAYADAGAFRDWPHPRSMEAIEAAARVAGSRIAATAAEAYTLLWGQL